MNGHGMSFGHWAAIAIPLLVAYFLPAVIAVWRSHHNRIAIAAVNVLLGWTFLGWVVALVWSLTATRSSIS